METTLLQTVDWSRAQFALTAMYHWLFVPLTVGLSLILGIMESLWYQSGNPVYKQMTHFWMKLFGINFAIGVATGLILEFQFGTNWSNYSWFVGDIFGAPLAIEGILAFFMESTFVAVMFFGWNKVSPRFHLISTWLVALGVHLSAFWILVANAWMQYPVGMEFNPETARHEMADFFAVAFSPVALVKFFHTITSGWMLGAAFVCGISAWFLLRARHGELASKSIRIAALTGLAATVITIGTGDASSRQIARIQPMKLAAMEGLREGSTHAGLTVLGWPSQNGETKYAFEIPGLLSWMSFGSSESFVPGIKDLTEGNPQYNLMPAAEKIARGKAARVLLGQFKEAKKAGRAAESDSLYRILVSPEYHESNFRYFGYGFLNHPDGLIPNIPLTFWSFRIMVGTGFFLLFLFALLGWMNQKKKLEQNRLLLTITVGSIFLAYLASQSGWVVAEVGRQPWVVQDYLTTLAAVSQLDATSVQITFFLFAFLFTGLLIAEISILYRQISKGPESH